MQDVGKPVQITIIASGVAIVLAVAVMWFMKMNSTPSAATTIQPVAPPSAAAVSGTGGGATAEQRPGFETNPNLGSGPGK